jgi:hypothetical protein
MHTFVLPYVFNLVSTSGPASLKLTVNMPMIRNGLLMIQSYAVLTSCRLPYGDSKQLHNVSEDTDIHKYQSDIVEPRKIFNFIKYVQSSD